MGCWDWTAIGTWILAGVAFIAVIYEPVRRYCNRPRLSVEVRADPPDCIRIPYISKTDKGVIKASVDSYFVRFRVKNVGRKTPAENVLAYLEKLEVLVDSEYEMKSTYIPLPLNWSNVAIFYFFPRIHKGIDTHCELGFILGPDGRDGFKDENITPRNATNDDLYFCFNTIVKPNSLSSVVPFGDYRVNVKVAASNARPISVVATFQVPQKWIEDESEMYRALHPKIVNVTEMK